MNSVAKSLFPFRRLRSGGESRSSASRFTNLRPYSAMSEDHKLGDLMDYLEKLKNYERLGVPRGAGTDTDDGFDLGRMRRLLQRLGNPHTNFKAVHIAGTKGKGSTATFLSNILREEGYSVGCYTSPHLLTIRERISVGRNGDHVSVDTLNTLFYQLKGILDQSIELENGALTHFEVFTALAFSTFSQEKVDIAIVEAGLGGARDATNVIRSSELAASIITSIGEEHLSALGGSMESIAVAKSGIIKHGRPLVIGGPFELHVEHIIRDKASSMNSAVISACDPGILSVVKHITHEENELPYQICDIFIQVEDKFQLFIELPDVKLQMLGSHQLKNAVTATCAALSLRDQRWSISDQAIRDGLERSRLMGRSQFLNCKEVESLGLSRATILVDGAHTEASARGIADVIQAANTSGPLALVIAMASDKDHMAFARHLLSGRRPDLVLLTEVDIAGSKSRSTSALALKDSWIRASVELGIEVLDIGMVVCKTFEGCLGFLRGSPDSKKSMMLIGCSVSSIDGIIKVADRLLRYRDSSKSGLIAVTGSLHIVASVLAFVDQ